MNRLVTCCKYCNKSIVSIHNERKNGKKTSPNLNDWETREYHKKCRLRILEIQRIKRLIENNL
jgi:hypothetical protein